MSKEEEMLIEEMETIYYIWDNVSKPQAREMLRKIFFQCGNKFKSIECRRLVLHNLTTIIMQILKDNGISDMSEAKPYAKSLKDMLDTYPNYTNNQINKERYCKALNNYTVCFEDELTKDEIIEMYQFCYDTYKDYEYNNIDKYMEKLIAKFNLYLAKGNFKIVFLVVEDLIIHNNTTEYDDTLKSFIKDIKNADISLYNDVLLLMKNQQKQII
jgi:uncharacterized UPF0160 family protein